MTEILDATHSNDHWQYGWSQRNATFIQQNNLGQIMLKQIKDARAEGIEQLLWHNTTSINEMARAVISHLNKEAGVPFVGQESWPESKLAISITRDKTAPRIERPKYWGWANQPAN